MVLKTSDEAMGQYDNKSKAALWWRIVVRQAKHKVMNHLPIITTRSIALTANVCGQRVSLLKTLKDELALECCGANLVLKALSQAIRKLDVCKRNLLRQLAL